MVCKHGCCSDRPASSGLEEKGKYGLVICFLPRICRQKLHGPYHGFVCPALMRACNTVHRHAPCSSAVSRSTAGPAVCCLIAGISAARGKIQAKMQLRVRTRRRRSRGRGRGALYSGFMDHTVIEPGNYTGTKPYIPVWLNIAESRRFPHSGPPPKRQN